MDKDIGIIKHILEHIENIFKTQKRFGSDISIFIFIGDIPDLYQKCKMIVS